MKNMGHLTHFKVFNSQGVVRRKKWVKRTIAVGTLKMSWKTQTLILEEK